MDPMSMLMMQNPQMMQALGMLRGGGGPPPPPATGGPMMGAPQEGPPPNPPAMPPGGPPPNPPATGMMPPAQGSPPGAMPNPAGMGDAVAGGSSSPKPPNSQEPTGEGPNQQAPQNSIPHMPRNHFGALLMPRGGQIGGSAGPAPNPSGAFNWQNILNSFLQKRGMGGPAGSMAGTAGAPGGGGPLGASGPPPVPY